ncbi:MAG: hypothetical protein Q8M05_04425 [Rhodoferax sp.]|uniref:hypothetical protein n=1 Tax=Rhodoferax sp. TaxID=50421 RepID=UPI0027311558|nr:hypothetical protein [Rhodoferax sp.]MDP1528607.1 hypothetical protein [Rhodoferax sp.]
MNTLSIGAVCAFTTLLTGAAMAQDRLPSGIQVAPPRLPAGAVPRTDFRIPVRCQVNPGVASVTLTKGSRRGQVSVSYEIINQGRSAWVSGARQQGVNLLAYNGNTGRTYRNHQAMPGSAAAGGTMLRFSSPYISNAFDDFEFGGHVDVSISYDPDIYIDGNDCNDDSNSANNRVRIENADILGFMQGTATSRTFR